MIKELLRAADDFFLESASEQNAYGTLLLMPDIA